VTKVKDPQAVDPWSIGFDAIASKVFVTNYASDNVTVIGKNNTIQNIPVGDGPGGTPDGPFGVVGGEYVTLFGSNEIPRKGIPIDYSSVGPGRVQVLRENPDGTYAPLTQISVGKGPRFPAMSESLCKLYVPCGGENRVDVIRIGSNKKIKEIPVGRDPSSCTLSVDEAKLYVTNFGDGTVSVIDTNTDTKIKDIPAPRMPIPGVSNAPLAQYPWNATISGSNGNLYIAYWGTAGDASPNGAIVEIDTCRDEVIRTIVDDSTQGTASSNTIAQRAFIPTSLRARNSAMAGASTAGSGGPFGIDSSRPGIFFTNDALGVVGMLDARIDQVVTPMPFGLASCQKPRGIASVLVERTPFPNRTFDHLTYVACGQPDNEVLIIRTPTLRENIPNVPVIESIDYGSTIKITGKGFMPGARLEAIPDGSFACLTFKQELKVKNDGTLVIQKGKLTSGRKLNPKRDENDEFISFRVINPDGTARMITVPPIRFIAVCPR
jgi:YVTN family beta-propeller protein